MPNSSAVSMEKLDSGSSSQISKVGLHTYLANLGRYCSPSSLSQPSYLLKRKSFLSSLSLTRCPYVTILFFLSSLSLPSLPRHPFLAILSSPSFPRCPSLPFLAILSLLSLPRCPYLPFLAVLTFPSQPKAKTLLTILSSLSLPFLPFISWHTGRYVQSIHHQNCKYDNRK